MRPVTASPGLPMAGQHMARPTSTPFGAATPSITASLLYAVATLVWVTAGSILPGGRWLAMHLFTLGVVTNLVLVFAEHFSATLTRSRKEPVRWQPAAVNLGILLILVGLPSGMLWATATGGVIVTGVVTFACWRLRRMRKESIGARFGWIVRIYERAHGAFVHGAILGLLLGLGLMAGPWYASARIAHLHVNIAGWAGLTLLATLVFFGPTMARTQIIEGADRRAATALKHGATGLTVAVLLLLATGVGGPAAQPLRLAAGAAMAVYAGAATVVCLPVAAAALRAGPSPARWPVIATSWWFVVVAWADVAVIATASWRLLDAIGIAMVVGVLVQSITATLAHLTPMLRAGSFGGRDRLLARLARAAALRAAAFNLGVAVVVASAVVRGTTGSVLATAGWALVAGSVLWLLTVGLSPPPRRTTPVGAGNG